MYAGLLPLVGVLGCLDTGREREAVGTQQGYARPGSFPEGTAAGKTIHSGGITNGNQRGVYDELTRWNSGGSGSAGLGPNEVTYVSPLMRGSMNFGQGASHRGERRFRGTGDPRSGEQNEPKK